MSGTHNHEKSTMWVVLLTAITMVVEIIFGLTTKSMALLADGIHMGSHVLAIGLSWLAYKSNPCVVPSSRPYRSHTITLTFK